MSTGVFIPIDTRVEPKQTLLAPLNTSKRDDDTPKKKSKSNSGKQSTIDGTSPKKNAQKRKTANNGDTILPETKKKKQPTPTPIPKDSSKTLQPGKPSSYVKRDWDNPNFKKSYDPTKLSFKTPNPWQMDPLALRPPPINHGALKIPIAKKGCLSNIGFAITGTLKYFTVAQLEEIITKHDGKIFRNLIGPSVKYLICGENPLNDKVEMAKKHSARCVDEQWFTDYMKEFVPSSNNTVWNPKRTGELWTTMFKPTQSNQILGNQKTIQRIGTWIKEWTSSNPKKAMLIYGQPGIGKTTAVTLISRENDRPDVLERNASDCRSKSSLQLLRECVRSEATRGTILVMDEVDGIGAGDQGGVSELIAIIKLSKIPIICICNDRYTPKLKSLITHCELVQFWPPTTETIVNRIEQVCRDREMEIDPSTLKRVVEFHHQDVRMTLNFLQSLSFSKNPLFYDDLDNMTVDNPNMGPFDVVGMFLNLNRRPKKYKELESLYHIDSSLVPLFTHENYLNCSPQKGKKNHKNQVLSQIQLIAKAADLISLGDTVDAFADGWSLVPEHCLYSTIYPTYLVSDSLQQTRFPALLGKKSTETMNRGVLEQFRSSISLVSCCTSDGLEDFRNGLISRITDLLSKSDFKTAISLMAKYKISKDQFDSLVNVTKFGPDSAYSKLPAKVKSNFTKQTKNMNKSEPSEPIDAMCEEL